MYVISESFSQNLEQCQWTTQREPHQPGPGTACVADFDTVKLCTNESRNYRYYISRGAALNWILLCYT